METDSSPKQDPHSRLKSYTVLYSYLSSPAPPLKGGDISNPSPLALCSNIHFYTRRAVEGSPRRVEKLTQRSKGEGYHNKKFWGLLHFEFRNSSAPLPPNPLPPVEGEYLSADLISSLPLARPASQSEAVDGGGLGWG